MNILYLLVRLLFVFINPAHVLLYPSLVTTLLKIPKTKENEGGYESMRERERERERKKK